MKEKYLHHLWKHKLLPLHKLQLSNGEKFKVIYQGEYNRYESGPDFLNAKIEIDGIVWIGNVELHVKSKDWYLHNHHRDRAYDNVILHVVYEDNGEIVQNDKTIPTLELKNTIDPDHYDKFRFLLNNKRTIICGRLVSKIPEIFMVSMQERALITRLNRKTLDLTILTGTENPNQILYFLLARSMGAKINQLPFEELTHRLPLSLLKKSFYKNQVDAIRLTSGLLQPESFSDLLSCNKVVFQQKIHSVGLVNRNSWKFGGTRPSNSPSIRILQFAKIVEKFDFDVAFVYLSSGELLKYINELLTITQSKVSDKIPVKTISAGFKIQLIINCFVPFIYWYGQHRQDDILTEKALDILRFLPEENNSTLDKWIENGIKANNAAESQALLEIFNEFCTNKKCLNCEIGIQLLVK